MIKKVSPGDDTLHAMSDHHPHSEEAEVEPILSSDTQAPETTDLIRVLVKNSCSYPIRILTSMDETTGTSQYRALKTFEEIELTVNLLTFRHLQIDPKIRMKQVKE